MRKRASEGRIFLSYRREDSSGYAGRLFDHVKDHFGKDRVFMDISNIEPGVDFVDSIEKALSSCDAFLVLIGKDWLDCRDANGKRRLDNPDDFIRIETSTALKRDVRVFPILVKGAEMPSSKDLPEDMAKLARRNAHELSDQRWQFDCNELLRVLESIVGSPEPMAPKAVEDDQKSTEAQKKNIKAIISLVLSALVVFSLVTEGIEDSDTFVGAIALVVVALILGVVGLYDVKMKKAGGRGMAIGSIVCSVLIGLMLVGDLPSEPVAIHPGNSEPIMTQEAGGKPAADLPAVDTKPTTEPTLPAKPAPKYARISGSWQGSDGMIYSFEQQGRQVRVYGLNPFGVQMMTGQGTFSGSNTILFNYTLADGTMGESTLEVAGNGQLMNGSFTNHTTGLFGRIVLSRQNAVR